MLAWVFTRDFNTCQKWEGRVYAAELWQSLIYGYEREYW